MGNFLKANIWASLSEAKSVAKIRGKRCHFFSLKKKKILESYLLGHQTISSLWYCAVCYLQGSPHQEERKVQRLFYEINSGFPLLISAGFSMTAEAVKVKEYYPPSPTCRENFTTHTHCYPMYFCYPMYCF